MPVPKTLVLIDCDTKRILGFSPEGIIPIFPPGTRYETKTPFDTLELENWLKKFREQAHFDAEEKAYRRIQREKPIRDSIKAAIRARNQNVNHANRDLNNALINFMDYEYDRVMAQQANLKPSLPPKPTMNQSSAKTSLLSLRYLRGASSELQRQYHPQVCGVAGTPCGGGCSRQEVLVR